MEQQIEKLLAIAHLIVEEDRPPTNHEREQFRKLEAQIQKQPEEWREKFADLLDRLAAALEGMGI